MNSEELRLGNYVMIHDYAKGNRQQVVDQLGSCQVNYLDEQYCTSIPLTEQWLEDFGFTWDDDLWVMKDLSSGVSKHDYDGDGERWYYSIESTIIEIHSVHQLQNLYFCLCGEELQLRENETM
jgi:hypothetical protein